ncbi:MAG: hypothetical protein PVH25_11640 [Burkholderiales bacterium]
MLLRQVVALVLASLCLLDQAFSADGETLPSFEELEAQGAVIGEVRVINGDIFDLNNPKEDSFFYRLANALHIRSRESVIRRALLFKSGEPVSTQRIEETQRLLQETQYLYGAQIRPIAYHDGVVDIEVVTRDTWTLDPGLGYSRKGGENEGKYGLKELNILGTGAAIEWQRTDYESGTVDDFQFNNNQILGTRARFNYTYRTGDTQQAHSTILERPFYSLETRWAAGIGGSTSDQLISTYDSNVLTEQYRRYVDRTSIYGGWSKGLVNNWTHRYFIGFDYVKDAYELEPGAPPPATLPTDEKYVSPFFRYQVIQNNYVQTFNRNQVQRPEYFLLGWSSDIKLGYAATALGSTRPAWNYAASIGNGWDMSRDRILTMALSATGTYVGGDDQDQLLSGNVQYFAPQSERSQTFVGLQVDGANDINTSNQLTLGGDNGLPGYPSRYQTGDRRVLLNLEQRFYSNWYPFRLFRIGGGLFFDVGRAWGGETTDDIDRGWLANIGVGLRVFSVRSAFGTVWRLDLAFPVNAEGDIPSYQVVFYREERN